MVIISWKNHTPRRVTTTPRTAEDTMCVMGEVTFILKNPAMQMRKPNKPCEIQSSWVVVNWSYVLGSLTVIRVPQRNVDHPTSSSNNNFLTSGPSPTRKIKGIMTIALRRFVYHARWRVLPPTTSRLCLIITADDAVVTEDKRPNMMPMELEMRDGEASEWLDGTGVAGEVL